MQSFGEGHNGITAQSPHTLSARRLHEPIHVGPLRRFV